MDFRLYLEKQNQRSIFFFFKQVGVLNQDIYLEFFKHTECWKGLQQKFVLKIL